MPEPCKAGAGPGTEAASTTTLFIGPEAASRQAYEAAINAASRLVLERFAPLDRAYRGTSPAELAARFAGVNPCPEQGEPLEDVLRWLGEAVLPDSIAVSHASTLAHLHCAPLIPSLAAEVLVSALNASMDSWDQAPAPTHLEQRVIDWLAGLFGLGTRADGIFTSGGTQSNFLGLLLARDRFCAREFGVSVQHEGLPAQASRLRLLCSEVAHFSVQQSAAILGLGRQAVAPVPVDAAQRMDPLALRRILNELRAEGLLPMAVVATAGTTDFGSIDPIAEIADIAGGAGDQGLWLHVDAAYGGALMLSERLRGQLAGIDRADSVTVDFHKMFWQPISASALLVRDRDAWETLRLHADYLNPPEAEAAGMLDLVTKSIQTTRRFDGLKLFTSLRVLGRRHFAALVERTVDLAREVASVIDADPFFQRVAPVAISSIVFRCVGEGWTDATADRVNAAVREQLLFQGRALIGRTRVGGHVCLKFTLLNPDADPGGITMLLQDIKQAAKALAAHNPGRT